MSLLYVHPDFGRIWTPRPLLQSLSLPGCPTRPRYAPGEVGIFVAVQKRPVFDGGLLRRLETIWASITHNERVDAGAALQAVQVFGGSGTPATPSATSYPKVIAVANATLTKAKGDQSLGSATSGVTTNEFTTIGLARVAATTPVGGDYTAPASLGGTFSQNLAKSFSVTGTGTAAGAGVFNSTTVAASILYVEDNFASSASVLSGDTLAVTVTITN
jgi:hypothetical protein